MNNNQKTVIGIAILAGILIGYALIADEARQNGRWVWLIVAAVILAPLSPAIKSKRYREGLLAVLKGAVDAVGSIFSASGKSNMPERQAVPTALRRKILNRANGRCQYPRCKENTRNTLDIHHIDMDPQNSKDDENLVVLCANHHRRVHNDGKITNRQVKNWSRGIYRSNIPRR